MHGKETYFQMFLFDDVWASANEHLAQSILFYSLGWNGLGAAMTGGQLNARKAETGANQKGDMGQA
jgi:hypothetical protein